MTTRTLLGLTAAGGALSILLLGNPGLAHPDDPKAKDVVRRYEGPGYRASQGGVAGVSFPSQNVTLRSWVTVPEFGEQAWTNDIWGYVTPQGKEFAIVGLSDGTGFVDVTDPDDAQVITVVPGPHSIWRDMKTLGQHCYAVSEGGGGIQVMDLGALDLGVVNLIANADQDSPASHNVALDEESGFLYRCGGSGYGIRIYDLSDPANPTFLADWTDRYCHDLQVVTYDSGQQVAFLCGGMNGGWQGSGLTILDVTDKANIVELAHYEYPNAQYSHQCWVDEEHQYLYLDDEFDEQNVGVTSTTHVIDISDLENPIEVAAYTNGETAITHNLFVRGDYLYAANYNSGLRVLDISVRDAPVEVAFFDVNPADPTLTFQNLWGNYPFLPSGIVLGSDRSNGLWVWSVDLEPSADINSDGVVDVQDLVALITAWGACPPACPEDLDGDGIVGVLDLIFLVLNWS